MIDYDQNDIDRLWTKIKFPDDLESCWETTLIKNYDGYSLFSIEGKNILAHRFMYMLYHQDDNIDKKSVCHSCDNRQCVNPNHLWLGTHQQNVQDMISKKRHVFGERNGQSKMTDGLINEMLIGIENNTFNTYNSIKEHFKISIGQISTILSGKAWTHITKNYDLVNIKKKVLEIDPRLKLTPENVRDIKQRILNKEKIKKISLLYNISVKTIYDIRDNRRYKDVI